MECKRDMALIVLGKRLERNIERYIDCSSLAAEHEITITAEWIREISRVHRNDKDHVIYFPDTFKRYLPE